MFLGPDIIPDGDFETGLANWTITAGTWQEVENGIQGEGNPNRIFTPINWEPGSDYLIDCSVHIDAIFGNAVVSTSSVNTNINPRFIPMASLTRRRGIVTAINATEFFFLIGSRTRIFSNLSVRKILVDLPAAGPTNVFRSRVFG